MAKTKIHLLHGWTYTLDNWEDFLNELKKNGFEPIVHKVPGLTSPSDEIWTVPKYVDWLSGKLKDEKHIIALGHSNGGRILMAYDSQFPGQISQLILLDSAGVYDARSHTSLKRKIGGAIAKLLKPIIPEGKLRRALYRIVGARDYGNAKPNMRKTMMNMMEFDKDFDLRSVSAPVHLIWGEHDQATPLYQGELLKNTLQDVRNWTVIKDSGHSPQIRHAQEVASIIKENLK